MIYVAVRYVILLTHHVMYFLLIPYLLQMVKRFRAFETAAMHTQERSSRQLIVAVTANGSDLTKEGFDEICAKPLSRRDINRIVMEHFHGKN